MQQPAFPAPSPLTRAHSSAGTAPWELPECLLGGMRLTQLDCKAAMRELDWSKELPL